MPGGRPREAVSAALPGAVGMAAHPVRQGGRPMPF